MHPVLHFVLHMTRQIACLTLLLLLSACTGNPGRDYEIISEKNLPVLYLSERADELIEWAVRDFADDLEAITGREIPVIKSNLPDSTIPQNAIFFGRFDDPLISSAGATEAESLAGKWETFTIRESRGNLLVAGSDIRGTVYGIFELAERLGISPWKWWADVIPAKWEKLILRLPPGGITASPSVRYRGIFLNDEDWGLQPWAARTFEPETGDIGPKTYEKIFHLLLRLKGNTIWPAMHPCTKAFFTIPGNKEMAERYHIIIGTSHAEPMLRNNVDEWDADVRGPFNYFINADAVNHYWQERLDEITLTGNEVIVTVGMRGIHDSGMEGNASMSERSNMLETIIHNQREMLERSFGKPAGSIPQVFIPYKEVLDLYDTGVELPGDITLMWTDDNYGYIRRLSNEKEQARDGGSGVYYHLSYWGRPHDYLWLCTTQPGLIWYEMSRAWQNGARTAWIVNVGDIKPAEYTMEFFLDLAWDTGMVNGQNIGRHLSDWAGREFGNANTREIVGIMEEYYRLAMLRKPEYMGWSRTEPTTGTEPTAFSIRANDNELQRRIDYYKTLEKRTEKVKSRIPAGRMDAFFQLVEYPVRCAALMNYKFLRAQQSFLAETSREKEFYAKLSEKAFHEIETLTRHYNLNLSGGKWNHMMSMSPRDLPAFSMPFYHLGDPGGKHPAEPLPGTSGPISIRASDYTRAKPAGGYRWTVVNGLGYSNAAVTLFPLKNARFEDRRPSLEFSFRIPESGNYMVEVRCLPTHANNFDHSLGIRVDDHELKTFPLNTKGRSEAWKDNVLRNYTPAIYPVTLNRAGSHSLFINVNQTGIVIDQIVIYPEGTEPFYEIRK